MKRLFTIALTTLSLLFTGCDEVIVQIPAGFVAKKLSPTGWVGNVIEAGQIDLGPKNQDNTFTSLVLLEATATSIKESFTLNGGNGIMFGEVPTAVDVYVHLAVSSDEKIRNSIFAQITPAPLNERTSQITLEKVYSQTARAKVRNSIRATLQKIDSPDIVRKDMQKYNDMLTAEIIKSLKSINCPLSVLDVSISNIMQDNSINDASNKLNAAKSEIETIRKLGEELQKNPAYLEKYRIDKQLEMFQTFKGNMTVIISDGKTPVSYR